MNLNTAPREIVLAAVKDAAALARRSGICPTQIRDITLDANGKLGSIYVGQDADGLARYITNFAI